MIWRRLKPRPSSMESSVRIKLGADILDFPAHYDQGTCNVSVC